MEASWKFATLRSLAGKAQPGTYQIAQAARDLVGKIQNTFTDFENPEKVRSLMVEHRIGVLLDDSQQRIVTVRAKMIMNILKTEAEMGTLARIDYDDMLWVPVFLNLPVRDEDVMYDWLLLDECQDLCPVQLLLLARVLMKEPRIRVLAAGDSRQSIYSFRGTKDTISELQRLLKEGQTNGLVRFTLSVCRRCPVSHIRLAKIVVPHISPAAESMEGRLRFHEALSEARKEMKGGDYVLCRASKPLVELAFQFVRAGIPARITGEKPLQKSLRHFFLEVQETKADPKKAAVEALRKAKAALLGTGETRRIIFFEDFYKTVKYLAEHCGTAETALKVRSSVFLLRRMLLTSLHQMIAEIFSKKEDSEVLFSTIHRAKGVTTDRVWILISAPPNDVTLSPCMQQFEEEELNIWYVGCTRARQELNIVSCPSDMLPPEEKRVNKYPGPPQATAIPCELLQCILAQMHV